MKRRLPKGRKGGKKQWELTGVLLVAAPMLSDPVFGKSVCLVLEHNDQGSVGIVLNRAFSSDVQELWKHLTEGQDDISTPPNHLNFGGPVSGPVLAIHDQESLAEAGNGSGVYVAAQVENLKKLTRLSPEHYRLFVGHAAWKKGQLEKEMGSGYWYPIGLNSELVFAHESDMWPIGIRSVGNAVIESAIGSDRMAAPGLN
jgi:putative transcriptional regulator